jgi:glycosyltransferase involved in cell wall biosynthesis
MTTPSLSILMPVFNERRTIDAAIADALGAPLPVVSRQLVVVDDGSTDGTREHLRDTRWPDDVTVVLRESNGGKGAAIATALHHATGELAAVLDADLEYRAGDIAALVGPLSSGDAAVVFGSRSWHSDRGYSPLYEFGNRGVTLVTNFLYGCRVSDIMSCHKAMRTDLFRSLGLRSRGFAVEAEITARVLRAGYRIQEVPISYTARSREAGKKLTALDGLRVLWTLLRCRCD